MQGPKSEKIKSMFSEVAQTYDKANDVLTFGLARLWRKKLVQLSNTPADGTVLDCATGTGDLALEFKKQLGPKAKVYGSDFCKEMLEFAPKKAERLNLNVTFELGDVLNLKYKDAFFNTVSIAYGIRNVENAKAGLAEMWRVLKPGGKLLVLETGKGSGFFNLPISIYTKHITPLLGGWVSKKKSAYSYLCESSQAFPSKQEFLNLGSELDGLKHFYFKTLMFGASYIYVFEKR